MSSDTSSATVKNGAPRSKSSISDDTISIAEIFDFVKSHDVVIKKEASEYQTEHLSTTGPVDSENLHMTEILERAISVGNSISQSSVNVNIGMNESAETVYNIGKIIETTFPQGSSKAQSTKGAAGTNVVSTNNYTQKNGNVNSDSERSSRDLSEEDVRLQVIMLK